MSAPYRFCDVNSAQYRNKVFMLSLAHRVVGYSSLAMPFGFISYEDLVYFGQKSKEKMVLQMALAKKNRELADVFEKLPTISGIELLLDMIHGELKMHAAPSQRYFGFDLACYLLFSPEHPSSIAQVFVEVFPRLGSAPVTSDGASTINYFCPFYHGPNSEKKDDRLIDILQVVLGDVCVTHPDELMAIADRFAKGSGQWQISQQWFGIQFLGRIAASVLNYTFKTAPHMVAGLTTTLSTGEPDEASLRHL